MAVLKALRVVVMAVAVKATPPVLLRLAAVKVGPVALPRRVGVEPGVGRRERKDPEGEDHQQSDRKDQQDPRERVVDGGARVPAQDVRARA